MNISLSGARLRISVKPIQVNEVHLWQASLKINEDQKQNLIEILTQGEIDKMNRFHFVRDQNRYLAARGLLRILLGSYLEVPSEDIIFEYNKFGKPALANIAGTSDVHFNLAHTNEMVLYAFSHKQVGVDIEYIRNDIATEEIVDNFFSRNEIQKYRNALEKDRKNFFYQYWVRKEAFIKAIGKGLSFPVDFLDVSDQNGGQWTSISISSFNKKYSGWISRDIFIDDDHVAAIAIEGKKSDILLKKNIAELI